NHRDTRAALGTNQRPSCSFLNAVPEVMLGHSRILLPATTITPANDPRPTRLKAQSLKRRHRSAASGESKFRKCGGRKKCSRTSGVIRAFQHEAAAASAVAKGLSLASSL